MLYDYLVDRVTSFTPAGRPIHTLTYGGDGDGDSGGSDGDGNGGDGNSGVTLPCGPSSFSHLTCTREIASTLEPAVLQRCYRDVTEMLQKCHISDAIHYCPNAVECCPML
jgi:hypothetical protein